MRAAAAEQGEDETPERMIAEAEALLLPLGANPMLALTAFARGRLALANERFGEHGFELIGFGKMFSQEVARLKSAQTEMKGNEAYVYTVSKTNPTVLVFEEGEWKISVAGTFRDDLKRRAKRIRAQSAAYNELAAEIKMGQYADPAAA